jgi:hypothetical protein
LLGDTLRAPLINYSLFITTSPPPFEPLITTPTTPVVVVVVLFDITDITDITMASLSLHEIRTRNSNALHARFESQPANTQKTYRKPQRDWKVCLYKPRASLSYPST